MSLADVPLGLKAHTLRVNGTTSDWIHPIEDCVYDYLVDQWSIQKPAQNKLKTKNRAYDKVGSHHFWIVRQKVERSQDTNDRQLWYCDCTLQINVLMKKLSKGEVDDDMDEMCREINRMLIEYSPHWIAGILEFDHITEVPKMFGPDDENNPFENTWITAMTVHAYYYLSTDFSTDTSSYNPAKYSAGVLSYKQDE